MKSLFMRSRHDCEITHAREHFHSAGDNIVCRVLCVNVYFYVGRRENLTRHFAYCSTPFCERPKNNYEIAMQHDNKTPTWRRKVQVELSCPNIRHFDPVWYVPDHDSTHMYMYVHDWTCTCTCSKSSCTCFQIHQHLTTAKICRFACT